MTPVLLDCDPGHDDAVAMIYAARHMNLVGVTTVFGNQSIDLVTNNALGLRQLMQRDFPVAKGAGKPLVGERIEAGVVHGKTGLDGAELPTPDRGAEDMHAVELILRTARAHRGELVLAATGALTNVALALSVEPKLKEWLHGITIMGGSTGTGNVTQCAEFNIYADPEAADAVLMAGVETWLVGLDVTRRVGVGAADIARLRQGGRLARTMGDLLDFFLQSLKRVQGIDTASLHDPCALVPFIDPTLIEYRHTGVRVELAGGLTRGMTVAELRRLGNVPLGYMRPSPPANVHLAREPSPRLLPHIVQAMLDFDATLT